MEPLSKLSFSLTSKNPNNTNKRPPSNTNFEAPPPTTTDSTQQFVTEFDPSKTLTHSHLPTHSIPRLENTWNPYKRMKNLDVPLHDPASTDPDPDPDLRFELETPQSENDSTMSYGLNLRSSDVVKETPKNAESVILQKFKEDMKILPEDRGMEEFVDVPVEGFGAAVMKAYGWVEGRGIGRNAKEDVKVKEYSRRGDKQGLGFVGESRKPEKKGNERRVRVPEKEKKVELNLKGVCVGKVVRVVSGRHYGLKGKVLEKFDRDGRAMVVLKLKSDEEVRVGVKEVAELGSFDEKICVEELRKIERRHQDTKKREERKNKKKGERIVKDERYGNGGSTVYRAKEEEKGRVVSWLTSHIKVRIISKEFKGGKFYLKKAKVVDVAGPNVCDICLDEGDRLIQGVHQDILETAVPKLGGPVLVLYGKHKGVFGYLREKNMEKETAVVQEIDSHEYLNVQLEQIAEYIGDPECIGY